MAVPPHECNIIPAIHTARYILHLCTFSSYKANHHIGTKCRTQDRYKPAAPLEVGTTSGLCSTIVWYAGSLQARYVPWAGTALLAVLLL